MEHKAIHQYIPLGCCNANADVESFHATIEQEFFDLETFDSWQEFFYKAQVYQHHDNFTRPNFSKAGKTPLQILVEDRPNIDPRVFNFPVYDLDALYRQKTELILVNSRDQYVHKLLALINFLWFLLWFVYPFFILIT